MAFDEQGVGFMEHYVRHFRFTWYACTPTGSPYKYDVIPDGPELDVVSASVEYNYFADIKWTCNLDLAPDVEFDPLTQVVHGVMWWRDPVSNTLESTSLGYYFLSANVVHRHARPGARGIPHEGMDLTLALKEDAVLDRYVVASGSNVVNAVGTLVNGVGFSHFDIDSHSGVLPSAMEWPPGTSKLKICNDLLGSIGYHSLTSNPDNSRPKSQVYQDPQTAEVQYAFAIQYDPTSVIRPGIDTTLDLHAIPNTWVGFVSEPDRATLRSVVVNDDPASLTSTVSRGRTIVEVVNTSNREQGAPPIDQATLDAVVLRAAQEDSAIFEEVKFTTGLIPFHRYGHVFTVDWGEGPLRYRETHWKMDCKIGGEMHHTMRRSVTI